MNQTSLATQQHRECILVVDDQAANIQTVGTLLNSIGYDIMTATSAGQALQRLSARTPDLILLDMMMPGVSGLDLCRQMQRTPPWEDIPIIFLSAAGEVNLITSSLEAGAVDYVTKPFHRGELLSRVRTHLALKAARDELRRIAADKNELLALIAHDFRNHLAAMQVHADFLAKNPKQLTAEASHSAVTISRESRRMARSVQELLANEAVGRESLALKQLNTSAVASVAAEAIRPLASAKNQLLILTLPEAPLIVVADAGALRQVLDNLLSNAVKFSPIAGRITLAVFNGGDEVIFSVTDSGPGFSDEDIARAFQRYVRLSARPTAGEASIGLGLCIAKKLTELMGGALTMGTTALGGQCEVRLPLVAAQSPSS